MKNMKKNQLKSRGFINYSFQNQTSENQASCNIRSQAPNRNSDPEYFDSPYKNSLSEIKQITLNDDGADDFRTPKPTKKVIKRIPKVPVITKNKATKRTKKKVTSSIEKFTKNNFRNLDVNPEHLQMALALSKSTLAEENPEEYEKSKEQDFPAFLSPEKIPKVGTILERYGFKLHKIPKLPSELYVGNSKESKNPKYSKFRFVTPTLLSRTDEEREALIMPKISLIISQGIQPVSEYQNDCQGILNSNILQKYHCHENHILNINMMAMDELKTFCYYCTSLNILPSQSVYGCLLKNWDEIPGREKSPERSSAVIDSDSRDRIKDNVIERQRICPSPDLFDSDNESCFLNTSETINRLSSSSLNMSPSKSSASLSSCDQNEGGFSRNLSIVCRGNNGIEYFESFNTDSEKLSEEVFCLKRSEESGFQETPEDETINLMSSSSNDSCPLEKIQFQNYNEESEENIDEVDQIQQTYGSTFKKSSSVLESTLVTEDQRVVVDDVFFDLTQNSPPLNNSDFGYESNQLSSNNMEYNLVNETENTNHKKMLEADDTCLCSVVENKLINQAEIMDQSSTFSSDNMVQDQFSADSFEKINVISDDSAKRLSSRSERQSNEYNSSKSLNVTDYITQMLNSQPDQGMNENNSDHSTQTSCSQETIVISDEELNYSSIHSRDQKHYDFYNLSDIDDVSSNKNKDKIEEDEIENIHSDLKNKYGSQSSQHSPEKAQFSQHSETKETDANKGLDCSEYVTPQKIDKTCEPVFHKEVSETADTNNSNDGSTPDNNILIKTTDVTPMVNYDQMDTPNIRRELDKFGFKPLKRPRAIKLLKYVYETTHPMVSSRTRSSPDQEDNRAVKRRRTFELGDQFLDEDLIFEKKISSKIVSCRIPLQIAWYNFVSENPQLQENILLYEPIQLEVVHTMLKEQSGCKFHIEDMITFLDKKCITFRTTQSKKARTKKIK